MDARQLSRRRGVIADKLDRASEQRLALRAEMDEWVETHGRKVIHRRDPPDGYPLTIRYALKLPEPFPARWETILGEIVHNLRSALDQAITLNALTNTKKSLSDAKRVKFIATESSTDWAEHSRQLRKHCSPDCVAAIEAAQPFNSAAGVGEVASVHHLWNMDKHEATPRFGLLLLRPVSSVVAEPALGRPVLAPGGSVLHDGDELVRLEFEPDEHFRITVGQLTVAVDLRLRFKVAFDDPKDPGTPADNDFVGLLDATSALVAQVLSAVPGGRP